MILQMLMRISSLININKEIKTMEVFMKKTAFLGMVILIVLFLGTCGGNQGGTSDAGIEYTDVVYSYAADGKQQVTIYLDGKGVPVSQSQRALTTDIAKMSHDFYEAVFWHAGSSKVARASWEIGQSAGIRGVVKDETGIPYPGAKTALPSGAAAVIFVGKNSDKTLFGIGELTNVKYSEGPDTANVISDKTISVTFTVSAIETRLNPQITVNPTSATSDIDDFSSFIGGTGVTGAKDTAVGDGVLFPYYSLPAGELDPKTATGTYTFFYNSNFTGGTATYEPLSYVGIRIINTGSGMTNPEPIKRWPRYMYQGQYVYINEQINFGTKVNFTSPVGPGPFTGSVPLTFDSTQAATIGVFSFVFRIPVYAMTDAPSDNVSPGTVNYSYVTWWITPGFSTNQYALDNGKDAGGCVFIGRGVNPEQVINIETAGMPWGSM